MRASYLYLDDIVEEQGHLFEIVAKKGYDLISFLNYFVDSKLRVALDKGSAWFCTLMGTEMFDYCLKDDKFFVKKLKDVNPLYVLCAEWLGQFYALAQYMSGLSSKDLISRIKPEVVINRYGVLHDMDLNLCVQKYLKHHNIHILDDNI